MKYQAIKNHVKNNSNKSSFIGVLLLSDVMVNCWVERHTFTFYVSANDPF